MVEKYYFRPDDETNFRDDENGPYVLYKDYEVLRERMSDALDCMQYLLNDERLAYERFRESLKEHWLHYHENRHARTQDIINHLREDL